VKLGYFISSSGDQEARMLASTSSGGTSVALVHSPRATCIALPVNTAFFGSIRQLFLDTARKFPFWNCYFTSYGRRIWYLLVKAVRTLAFQAFVFSLSYLFTTLAFWD